jgi:ABC-type multidrug transport system fused ATPase/permease subunit
MKILYLLLLITILPFTIMQEQDLTSLNAANQEYDGIFGVGWGIFAIVLAVIVGVLCCIFGLATVHPLVFYIIGFVVPILTFIFMIIVPLTQPGDQDLKDNTISNPFIVVKWLFFSVMLVALILVCIPICKIWTLMLIPQRVDSRAQRDYQDKYEKMINEEKEKLRKIKEQTDKENEELRKNLNNPRDDVALPVNNEPQNIEMENLENPGMINENNNEPDVGREEQKEKKRKTLMNLRKKILEKTE